MKGSPVIDRQGTTKRYSDSTCYGGVVHLVEVPAIEGGTIESQAASLFECLDRAMASAGTDKSRLLMVQVYLVDLEGDYEGFNSVWEEWLPPGCAPARACVEVSRLARKGWKVELVVTAARRENG
ncbi:MAG TPA: RidA family protein [Limnobacter sp.]|nr:RidA family protein [Limnobacter sp.]